MRRLRVPALALALVAGGCFLGDSPGGVAGKGGPFPGGDDDDGLYHGEYALTAASIDPATCGLSKTPFFAQFPYLDAYYGGSYLDLQFGVDLYLTYDVNGTALHAPSSPDAEILDLGDLSVGTHFGLAATYDCRLLFRVDWIGEITASTQFTLNDVYFIDTDSGTECDLVADSAGFAGLPCVDSENTTWSL